MRSLGDTGKADGQCSIREPGDLPSSDQSRAVRDAAAVTSTSTPPTRCRGKRHPMVLSYGAGLVPWGMSVSEQCRPRLIICTTCRAGRAPLEDEPTPGARLYAELERMIIPSGGTASVELRQVACLANCERGCSGVITMPGKWTYLLGFLSSDHAADLLTYGAAYACSANGTVLPSRRPASLRYSVVGRVPPTEFLA